MNVGLRWELLGCNSGRNLNQNFLRLQNQTIYLFTKIRKKYHQIKHNNPPQQCASTIVRKKYHHISIITQLSSAHPPQYAKNNATSRITLPPEVCIHNSTRIVKVVRIGSPEYFCRKLLKQTETFAMRGQFFPEVDWKGKKDPFCMHRTGFLIQTDSKTLNAIKTLLCQLFKTNLRCYFQHN